MYLYRTLVYWTGLCLSVLLFMGCGDQTPPAPKVIVGTIAGPETLLVETAAEIAHKRFGLTIEIKTFQDYVMPNRALAEGQLDANLYQHEPYLAMARALQKLDLKPIAKTFLYPMGLYSQRYNKMDALPHRARIGVPNDPSNLARALLLLDESGWITLKNQTFQVTLQDIESNPHEWTFEMMDAALLPRALSDLDAALINTNYASLVHLSPSRDALLMEGAGSPYANLIVVRGDQTLTPELNQLIECMHDEAVIVKAFELFGADAIPAWPTKQETP